MQKGRITLTKINIFLYKFERVVSFDEIDFIEIVMKGSKKGTDDNRKYFIRIHLTNKSKPIEFGYTWSFDKIKEKYQICLAMIKGMVVSKVHEYLIKDESKYYDYVY